MKFSLRRHLLCNTSGRSFQCQRFILLAVNIEFSNIFRTGERPAKTRCYRKIINISVCENILKVKRRSHTGMRTAWKLTCSTWPSTHWEFSRSPTWSSTCGPMWARRETSPPSTWSLRLSTRYSTMAGWQFSLFNFLFISENTLKFTC